MDDTKTQQKARDEALRWLAYRPRSESELRDRLRRRGYEEEVITEVLAYLRGIELVDDEQFAALWVRDRIARKQLGARRLSWELRQKGVETEVIQRTVAMLLDEERELALAREVATRAWPRYAPLAPAVARRRLRGLLERRGYAPAIVSQVLREFFQEEKEPSEPSQS